MKRVKYKKSRESKVDIFEYTGSHITESVAMQLFIYNSEELLEIPNVSIAEIHKRLNELAPNAIAWLNIHGLHDVSKILKIKEILNVDNYVISDVLNVLGRTKIEELDDFIFFSVKSILQEEAEKLKIDQISFILKDNLVVSFQEVQSDYFLYIRERLRNNEGIVRKKGADYLLFLLLDGIIENFFITIENYETRIEQLLIDAKTSDATHVLVLIEKQRENLNYLKRSILPLRDALFSLKNIPEHESNGIAKTNARFYVRLYQKSLELLEQVEYDINTLEGASNLFYSTQNQKMNQIMKTLTVFSVIFMPLTFIVGVYGMNFENIPELKTHNGYYITWLIMILISIGMVYYFKRKNWF
ncbi:magnesium/cobalt transporter CorA [Flavobacterium sp.]|uniref:magnesium/cobalt transporter CorA n=1 Tax=Flavobacterium sp. TaxID=239 RepID=UPI0026269553|nr:magnesium/cobalt transporter CorA [Flavobacterium sp.]MDD3005019.1 magnesium/cobalt transporter CorA [Flavobacterium sp.]